MLTAEIPPGRLNAGHVADARIPLSNNCFSAEM
jgi:hypothetical protein